MLSLPISLFQKLYCKTVLFKVSDKATTIQGKNNPNADIQNSALLVLQQRKWPENVEGTKAQFLMVLRMFNKQP